MFSKFLSIVGITALLFLVGGFFLPRFVHVERSLEIEMAAAPVFSLLNSYSTFASWSPWAERDPDANYEFSGPEAGVGARMSWSGDPRLVGSGWQEITESIPHSLVRTWNRIPLRTCRCPAWPASGTRVYPGRCPYLLHAEPA